MKPSSLPTPGPQDGAPGPQTLRSRGSVLPPSRKGNIIAGRSDLKDRCMFLRSEDQEMGLQTGQRGRSQLSRLCGCLGCPPRLPEAPLQRAGRRPGLGGGWGGVAQPVDGSSLLPSCTPSQAAPCLCESLVGLFLSWGAMDPQAGWQGTAEEGRSTQAAIWAPRDLTCLSVCLSVCRWTAPSARAAPPKASSPEAPSPGPPAPCLPPCAPRPAPAPPKPCSRSPTRSPHRAPHAA